MAEQPGVSPTPAVASAPMDAPGSHALVPSEPAKLCSGIAVDEEPLAPLQASFRKYVQYGQPRTLFKASEKDPLASAKMNQQDDIIYVQAGDCSGQRREGAACKACFRLAMRASFRQHIAKKAFFIDSVLYCWRLFHAEAREIHHSASQMRQADYCAEGLAGDDMEQLLAEGESKLDKVRGVCRRAECIPKWRRSESLQRFLDDFLLSPHLYHSTDVEAKTSGLLATSLADSLAKGEVRRLDLQLASKIASGQLRTDGFIHALVTAFLMRCQTQASDPRYRTTSKHSDLHAVQEALATLGRDEAMKGVLDRFGFNLRAVDKSSLESSSFPNPYVAIRNEQEMATSVRRALAGLRLVGGRACVLLDETVWAAAYEQVGTLRSDPPGCAWIGGSWAMDAANDFSYLMTSSWKASDLPRDRLAKMTLHLALKRPDHNRFIVDSLVLPRKQGCSSAEEMLQVAARFLAACASSNNQIPPVGVSFDGATNNTAVNKIFLGLVPEQEMLRLPFFEWCELQKLPREVSFWPFAQLLYRPEGKDTTWPMSSFLDGWHLQKRFSLQASSGARILVHGAVWTCLTGQMRCGVGARTHSCSDPQSDRQSVCRLSPAFTPRSWECAGAHIHQMLGALIAAVSTASVGFDKAAICENSFALHYLTVLHVMHNRGSFGHSDEV